MASNRMRLAVSGGSLVAGGILLSIIATWTASNFGFHSALGGRLFGLPVYAPLAPFSWFRLFDFPWPAALGIGCVASVLTIALAAALSLRFAVAGTFGVLLNDQKVKRSGKRFGSDHWAKMSDIIEGKFIMGKGKAPGESTIIRFVGMFDGEPLTVTDDRFIGAFGAPGTYKTRSVMTLCALSWGESAIIYGAGKNDIMEQSSGFRATFSDVVTLDLGDMYGWRYNPLDQIRIGTLHEIDDTRMVAAQFPPQEPEKAKVPYWPTEGAKVLGAAILHVLTSPAINEKTLGGVLAFMTTGGNDAFVGALSASSNVFVRSVGVSLAGLPAGRRGELIATAQSYVAPWTSPIVDAVTAVSDFDPENLLSGPRPMTIYLRCPSDLREELRPVLKVVIAQALRSLLHDEKKTRAGHDKRWRVMFEIDEFHAFRFPGFERDLAEMRGYGGYLVMATPSPKSLKEAYGPNQAILDMTRVQLYLGTGDADIAEMISEMVGTATDINQSRSQSRQPGSLVAARTVGHQEHTRAVIDPGAVRALPNDKMIVLNVGSPPILADKLMDYEKSPLFAERVLPAVSTKRPESNTVKQHSNQGS